MAKDVVINFCYSYDLLKTVNKRTFVFLNQDTNYKKMHTETLINQVNSKISYFFFFSTKFFFFSSKYKGFYYSWP